MRFAIFTASILLGIASSASAQEVDWEWQYLQTSDGAVLFSTQGDEYGNFMSNSIECQIGSPKIIVREYENIEDVDQNSGISRSIDLNVGDEKAMTFTGTIKKGCDQKCKTYSRAGQEDGRPLAYSEAIVDWKKLRGKFGGLGHEVIYAGDAVTTRDRRVHENEKQNSRRIVFVKRCKLN